MDNLPLQFEFMKLIEDLIIFGIFEKFFFPNEYQCSLFNSLYMKDNIKYAKTYLIIYFEFSLGCTSKKDKREVITIFTD